ncbi:chemotaxis protein CheB [Kaarinaea lacus]
MQETALQSTKVAILASSNDQSQQLRTLLEKSGLEVVLVEADGHQFLDRLKNSSAEVLLIDVCESDDTEMDVIDSITEQNDLPILFNDSGPEGVNIAATTEIWGKKLAEKLSELAKRNGTAMRKSKPLTERPHPMVDHQTIAVHKKPNAQPSEPPFKPQWETEAGEEADQFADLEELSLDVDTAHKIKPLAKEKPPSEINVWVLGASLGGPQAVRQFLSAISPDLPVAFILAQHIGASHINLLAEQLNRVTPFTVVPGRNGHKLRHHEVILTPADKQLSLTDDGYIALTPSPPAAVYSPSIDLVMTEVARQYGAKAGTIIFSGMGDDGARGCEAIAEHGGVVWAQDIASCVVSSMPDQARKTGKVSYSANPEELAKHLYDFYHSNT